MDKKSNCLNRSSARRFSLLGTGRPLPRHRLAPVWGAHFRKEPGISTPPGQKMGRTLYYPMTFDLQEPYNPRDPCVPASLGDDPRPHHLLSPSMLANASFLPSYRHRQSLDISRTGLHEPLVQPRNNHNRCDTTHTFPGGSIGPKLPSPAPHLRSAPPAVLPREGVFIQNLLQTPP